MRVKPTGRAGLRSDEVAIAERNLQRAEPARRGQVYLLGPCPLHLGSSVCFRVLHVAGGVKEDNGVVDEEVQRLVHALLAKRGEAGRADFFFFLEEVNV